MYAVGEGGIDVGVQRTRSSIGITFYARYLHETTHRVAGHAQVVFKPHLGRIFYLGWATSKELVGSS